MCAENENKCLRMQEVCKKCKKLSDNASIVQKYANQELYYRKCKYHASYITPRYNSENARSVQTRTTQKAYFATLDKRLTMCYNRCVAG